jgi:hypothetical protein
VARRITEKHGISSYDSSISSVGKIADVSICSTQFQVPLDVSGLGKEGQKSEGSPKLTQHPVVDENRIVSSFSGRVSLDGPEGPSYPNGICKKIPLPSCNQRSQGYLIETESHFQ